MSTLDSTVEVTGRVVDGVALTDRQGAFGGRDVVGPRVDVAFLRQVLADRSAIPEVFSSAIREFLQRVDSLQKLTGRLRGGACSGFEREYREICRSIDGAPWYDNAITPQTKHTIAKNRYSDVLPFERTRVRLPAAISTGPAGDYINANFIDDTYIACCAPIPNVLADFWHMIWHSDVHVILMLTNFVERNRRKADLYWDSRGHAIDFNGVFVQLVQEEQHPASDGFIIRMFKVWTSATESQPRLVQHVQLTIWPDHGVLRDFQVIAPMLQLVNSYRDQAALTSGRAARIVVHCSAGIGRSGTFIAIDIILQALHGAFRMHASDASSSSVELLRQSLNVPQIVHRIRSQRPGMVQTPEQYEMIYRYIAAILTNSAAW
ncbi:hypothetical protein Poli38472_001976 [Pythium oligandrum]|uniref:Uncharacterized protein n=1 Tax=Pythium oligandrum TaxID=41045 RepID=A0A8K1CUG3_PYTOL|nr:hypothetical protein Poli38472_001976 [Pythium oligandrum]|eukprot:TMW69820.1 hypothetical protein Poli38472_001976 [Pythium oligandrum]